MDLENTRSYKNGIFGIDSSAENSQLVLLPVPWEVTASYGSGTNKGPEAILKQSPQLDLFDYDFKCFVLKGIHWDHNFLEQSKIEKLNKKLKPQAQKIQGYLEENENLTDELKSTQNEINKTSEKINQFIYEYSKNLLSKNKSVGLIGGDHSAPFGLIKALSEKHSDLGILHIDAHADLRVNYQGFTHSHASIIKNALDLTPKIKHLTQVGIRDFCESEYNMIQNTDHITCFFDPEIKSQLFNGTAWSKICNKIIQSLPSSVYISFDIDGLSPDLCPNTGTPVPGGLSFEMASELLKQLTQSNKNIVGFDLCEVAPGENSTWDGNVGARVLFKLCGSLLT